MDELRKKGLPAANKVTFNGLMNTRIDRGRGVPSAGPCGAPRLVLVVGTMRGIWRGRYLVDAIRK